MKVNMLVTQLCLTFCDLMYYSHQAPLSMEFSREKYWSGMPLPSPESFDEKVLNNKNNIINYRSFKRPGGFPWWSSG